MWWFLLLCVHLLTFSSSGLAFGALCPGNQSSLLLKLKHGCSDGSSPGSWIPRSDCCLWERVTCDNTTGLITGLDLSFLDFINSSTLYGLEQLTNLRFLDLSWCELEVGGNDQLLKKIFQLPNLHTLNLSFNYISTGAFPSIPPNNNVPLRFLGLQEGLNGTIPKSIFNLKFLDHLDLSQYFLRGGIPENQLIGGIPKNMGDLRFLKYLDLSKNQLTGEIPEKLGDLKLLSYMDLSSNNLTGGIPAKLGHSLLLTHLDLSSNNLSGGIPGRLGDLKFLNYLDLSSNNLSGEIPKEIRRFKFLSYLDLSNNMLRGTIPSFLLGLPTLQQLRLANNLFNGSLSEFTNPASSSLSTLYLSNNRLSGQIPSSIAYLAQLKDLRLSSNNFSGTVYMGMFRSLIYLTFLDLSDNSFTVEFNNVSIGNNAPLRFGLAALLLRSCNISEFWWFFLSNHLSLFHLDLSNNRIHGAVPNWIWQFDLLIHLNLSRNLLTSIEKPVDFSSCYLETLDLHDNMLEGSLPIPPTAYFLDYSNNRFASMIPADIGRYLPHWASGYVKGRYFLSLSNNKFVGEIPLTICNISSFLKVLDMSNNNLTGPIPWCLTNTTRMIILSLGGNHLHGNIPDGFVQNSSLRTLDLNSNQFSGPIPKSLINCTKLQVLDLGNNHLSDTFPSWLENLPHLYVLALRSNQFHGMIKPNQIRGGFQRLQIIDLSTNKFTGNLPVEYIRSWKFIREGGQVEQEDPRDKVLGFEEDVSPLSEIELFRYDINVYYQDMLRLTSKRLELMFKKILNVFTYVDLSNNKFDGRIPAELGNLKFLVVLNLSLNNLNGQIPSSLGNLSWVESMDLSHNSLSGEIPHQLTNLNFLEVLDLSENRLTGRIPEGAQFSTFTNASFEGNLGLCGPPLSLKCTAPSPPMEPTKGEATMHHEVDKLDFIIAGILGFFCGITLVIWPLLFSNKWRRWYYGCVDKVLMRVSYYLCCM